VGCAALLGVGLVGSIAFFAWLARPGVLLEPAVLLGPDTTGYAEWELRADDPGTRGFVVEALRRAHEEQDARRPEALRPFLQLFDRSDPDAMMAQILPMVVAWTLHPGEGVDDDLHLVTVSLERMGNQLVFGDWMLGWFLAANEGIDVVDHRGERLYVLADSEDRRTTFFLRGNDVFFATDPVSAARAVERLDTAAASGSAGTSEGQGARGGGGSQAGSYLARLFRGIPTERPLRAAVSNGRGELMRLWESFGVTPTDVLTEETWRAIDAATLEGGLETDGSLAGTLTLHAARAWSAPEAEEVARQVKEAFLWLSPTLEVEPRPEGPTLHLPFRAPDLLR
jgi:hypothetical protein